VYFWIVMSITVNLIKSRYIPNIFFYVFILDKKCLDCRVSDFIMPFFDPKYDSYLFHCVWSFVSETNITFFSILVWIIFLKVACLRPVVHQSRRVYNLTWILKGKLKFLVSSKFYCVAFVCCLYQGG
jgi:hypothetical protein